MTRQGDKPGSNVVARYLERLSPVGELRTRPLFGATGIFLGAVVFAMVWKDELYLKVDPARPHVDPRHSHALRYESQGRPLELRSFWLAPSSVTKTDAALLRAATQSVEVARRSHRKAH